MWSCVYALCETGPNEKISLCKWTKQALILFLIDALLFSGLGGSVHAFVCVLWLVLWLWWAEAVLCETLTSANCEMKCVIPVMMQMCVCVLKLVEDVHFKSHKILAAVLSDDHYMKLKHVGHNIRKAITPNTIVYTENTLHTLKRCRLVLQFTMPILFTTHFKCQQPQ